MSFNYEEWEKTMIRNHGPDWRQVMRQRASTGGKVKCEKGLAKQTPERREQISQLGVKASLAARRIKYVAQS